MALKKFKKRLVSIGIVLLVSLGTPLAGSGDSLLDPAAGDILGLRPMKVGELVTVVITDSVTTSQSVVIKNETSNNLTTPTGTGLLSFLPQMGLSTSGNADRNESSATSSDFSNTVTAEVVEVLPGDVIVIQATSSVQLDGHLRKLIYRGKVRRADIPQSNVVTSDKIASSTLHVDGAQASPTGGGGIFNWILTPFR